MPKPRRDAGSRRSTDETVLHGTSPTHDLGPPEIGPGPSSEGPVLGAVAIYSEATDDRAMAGSRSELGRLYLLREGEVLFLGKPPAPRVVELPDGNSLPVTYAHLFPFSREYGFVSRRHLAVAMLSEGRTVVHDFSTNGIYLMSKEEHVRRSPDAQVRTTEIQGREIVVLGLDLSRQRDRAAKRSASRHRLEVVPFHDSDFPEPGAS